MAKDKQGNIRERVKSLSYGQTLNLVDHLLKNGSFQCVEEFRDKKDKIVNFQQFYYFEGGHDRGFASKLRDEGK